MKKFIVTTLLLFGLSFNASADTSHTPETSAQFVQKTLVEVQQLINADVDTEERLNAFMPFIDRTLDVPYFVKALFHKNPEKWNNATDAEKNRAIQLMKKYIANLYINNFTSARDGRITVTNIQVLNDDKSYINVTIEILGVTDFDVAFKTVPHGDTFKIRDFEFGGISILNNQRGSYRRTIRKGGIEGFIAALERKITTLNA